MNKRADTNIVRHSLIFLHLFCVIFLHGVFFLHLIVFKDKVILISYIFFSQHD
jgi:hypothetical protein